MDAQTRRIHQMARPHFLPTRFSPTFSGPNSSRNTSNERTPTLSSANGKSNESNRGIDIKPEIKSEELNDVTTSTSSNHMQSDSSTHSSTLHKSTSKMSSKGPVSQEFTTKGTTPSGKPRLFVCEVCTRAFARQEHLKRHERSHTKEKPFACNICSRKFSRRDLLLRHSTKLHAGAADVIPRLRKKSLKYSKKGESELREEERDHLTETNTEKITNPTSTIITNATSVSTLEVNSLFRNPVNKLKGHVKKPKNNSATSTASTKRKIKNLIKNNSEGLQLPVLPEDIAELYNTLDSKNTRSTLMHQNMNGNTGAGQQSDLINDQNQLLENLEFGSSYRRASFSAMSGTNYAMGADADYATETVEFSTPQYNSIIEDLKTGVVEANNGDNADQNYFVDNWLSNSHSNNVTLNKNYYPGYSFYNEMDDGTLQMTEEFGRTNLGESLPKSVFKNGSQMAPVKNDHQDQSRNLKFDKNQKHGIQVDIMNLTSLEQILNTKFPHPVERERGSSSQKNDNNFKIHKGTDPSNDDMPISDLPPLSPLAPPHSNTLNQTGPQYWRSLGVNGLLSGLYNSTKDYYGNSRDNLLEQRKPPYVDKSSSIPTSNGLDNATLNLDKDLEHKVRTWQETLFNQPISDLERLNDMHVSNTYGIPQGYSFYGEYESSSQDLNALIDSEATISPVLLESPSAIQVDDNLPSMERNYSTNVTMGKHSKPMKFDEEFHPSVSDSLSHIFLFTPKTHRRIDEALAEYPYMGIPTPLIPSDEVLNLYVDQFINKFLTHHPFVHKAALNEFTLITNSTLDMKKYSVSVEEAERIKNGEIIPGLSFGTKVVRDDLFDLNFKVSLVCLPFLVTTLGAVVSNKKEDAASLYEASRRCIHVYLETRRRLTTIEYGDYSNYQPSSSFGASPLWLIQSLTLSVIYGLFADEEISLSVIIRQVHALNTLLKSSGLNSIKYCSEYDTDFDGFIKHESTVRTIHMIFHVSTLLSTLYNIVPSLTVADMGIDLPCSSSLWDCYTEDEYLKLIDSFDFRCKNFREVLENLVTLDFTKLNSNEDSDYEPSYLSSAKDFFFRWHVSEFGLTCLQNGLHQMAYFHYLGKDEFEHGIGFNHSNGESMVTWSQLVMLGKSWNVMVSSCKMYNEASEVFSDSKILNHYLNLKLCSIVSLNKIKESVWLKSFNNINEEYYSYFNYGDNELKDQKFQSELIRLVSNSIDIMKLIFFNDDISLLGSISERVELKNETIEKLDSLYATPPAEDAHDISDHKKDLNVINLNILHKLSIDSQILFDVILIIVKFLISFENIYKLRLKFNNLSAFTFLDEGERRNDIQSEKFDELLFKYYVKFFKIYLNLEQFMKLNYDYEDFETEQPISGNPFYSIQNLRARGLAPYSSRVDENEIDRVLRESRERIKDNGQWLRNVVTNEIGLSDRELIMNELIGFRLPYKFLKIGGFLFGFIYDRNFKFVNFRHLSDVLFHLRVFLESKDEDVE